MKLKILSLLIIIVMGGQTVINVYAELPEPETYLDEAWQKAFPEDRLASNLRARNSSEDKTYNQPRYRDDRLDWCLSWGKDCGRPAAVAFCNRKQFRDVLVFRAEVVGKSARTRLFGDNRVCEGQDYCTAFAYITCTNPFPGHSVFVNPSWNDYRLDACKEWGANCGKPAADTFCQKQGWGFREAVQFTLDAKPGYSHTRLIGTNQICDKSHCVGFQQIICQ